MDTLLTAVALAFIAERNFVLQTDSYDFAQRKLREGLKDVFGVEDVVQVDLETCAGDASALAHLMIRPMDDGVGELRQVVVWKGLEKVHRAVDKNNIVDVLSALERYDTLALRLLSREEPLDLGGMKVLRPAHVLVVPIIVLGDGVAPVHQHIKDRLWFSQTLFEGQELHTFDPVSVESILRARERLRKVYVKPTVQEYVCSLLVFTRSHRLCSVAPLTTRPSLRAHDGILSLAKALVVWANMDNARALFVTPEFCKVAYRKVGYWLVNWETNDVFKSGDEYRRRFEISMLTGDWYGSEWRHVKGYMDSFASERDPLLSTGFTNAIVDEVLVLVRPPM